MKRFSIKLVAFLFLVFLLFGFFHINDSFAQVFINPANSDGVQEKLTGAFGKVVDYAAGILALPGFVMWQGVFSIINFILSMVLALVGTLFDFSIRVSIEKFSDLITPNSPLTLLWGLIRDAINISLIFILLYIAIAKIVGSLGIKAKSTLVSVIVTALFINFSMFITRLIIDLGNLFAVAFYNQIINSGDSISFQIIQQMHFVTLFKDWTLSATGQGKALVIMVLQAVMVGTTIWALFTVSMLFIGRAVMLIFLIISSPIGFIGSSIPWIKDKADEWRESLLGQVLVAPVFLFLFMIVLNAINLLPKLTASVPTSQDKIDPKAYFGYLFIIILLIKSVNITKKYSGEVAKAMTTALKVAGTAALVAVTGGAALAGGAAAGVMAGARGIAASTKLSGTMLGRGLQKGASSIISRGNAVSNTMLGRGLRYGVNASTDLIRGKNADGVALGDDKSIRGKSLNFLRGNSLSTIKKSTDGKVDIESLEKKLSQASKDAAINAEKQAERIGPQKDIDRANQINNTKENIEKQTEEKMKNSKDSNIYDGQAKDIADLTSIEKELLKTEKRRLELEREEARLVVSGDISGAHAVGEKVTLEKNLENELKKSGEDLKNKMSQKGNFGLSEIEKIRDKFNAEKENTAREMGVDIAQLDTELDELGEKIIQKTQARNEFIKGLTEGGNIKRYANTGILGKGEAKKIADRLRAQKGKYVADTDLIKNLKKIMKDAGIKEEETPKP